MKAIKLAAISWLSLSAIDCLARNRVSIIDPAVIQADHIQRIMEAVRHGGQPSSRNPEVFELTISLDPNKLPALILRDVPGPITQVTLRVRPNPQRPLPLDIASYGPQGQPRSRFYGLTVTLEQSDRLDRPWQQGNAARVSAHMRPQYNPIAPNPRAAVVLHDAFVTRMSPNHTVAQTLPSAANLRTLLRPLFQQALRAFWLTLK